MQPLNDRQNDIFINIGTTTEEVAAALAKHQDLLVITNNLNVAMARHPSRSGGGDAWMSRIEIEVKGLFAMPVAAVMLPDAEARNAELSAMAATVPASRIAVRPGLAHRRAMTISAGSR